LSVKQINDWQSIYGEYIDFLCVYIAEAHANDVWPLGKHVDLPSHQSFEDRVAASDILINKYGFNRVPVYYDTMNDAFDSQFSVWPERYYIIKDGNIDHIFSPTIEYGFDRDDIKNELTKRLDHFQNVRSFIKALTQ